MTSRRSSSPLSVLAAALLVAALLACSGGEGHAPQAPTAGQTVAVEVAPPEATVQATGTVAFGATVTGTQNVAVTWSLQPAGCGAVSSAGVFTAPGAAATCVVVATSAADPTKSAAATVTITAPPPPPPPPVVAVQLSPPSAALTGCGAVTFTATVTGTSNVGVTWSIQEGAAGGTLTAAGVYTAPAAAGTYHVVAKSVADGTKSAVAAVTVTEKVLSVSISPAQVTVPANGSATFTATVTTTCGSFQSTKTVSSNGVVSAN